ncbi:MAG: phosphoribosylanthranilate isomerase [Pseudomonadota bacterium]
MRAVQVKICGLNKPADADAVAAAGAQFAGLVFYAKSPRCVTLDQAASISAALPPAVTKVALVVNADDAVLAQIVAGAGVDMLQFHGAEPPERVAEVKARFGLPVMKAVGVADAADLAAIDRYARVADWLLIDAKPPKSGALPGGNGLTFDWRLIAGQRWSRPWMLAGGLTSDNVAAAIEATNAPCVDVSSGVEAAPGEKDPALIAAFTARARSAAQTATTGV